MFYASAAFKGGDIQNLGEGGRILYGGFSILWKDLITPLETMTRSFTRKVAFADCDLEVLIMD